MYKNSVKSFRFTKMSAKILDGKLVAQEIRKNLEEEIRKLHPKPGLAFVQVGVNPASTIYVDLKNKACQQVGIYSEIHRLPDSTSEDELLLLINELNFRQDIHGILVQLPLPPHINTYKTLDTVNPLKDVDGLNSINIGYLHQGRPGLIPATPKGIVRLLDYYNIELEGRNTIVIGRSNLVGRPIAELMTQRNSTVTLCHSKSKSLKEITRKADILISAAGNPAFIKGDMLKEGVVLVDVGISKLEDKIVGDMDFESVKEIAGYITPVPGGIGPMTIAMVLENTLEAYKKLTYK